MDILKVKNLKTYYFTHEGSIKAVDNISFTAAEGEKIGLAGESGCGKSTVGLSLLRLVPSPGKICGGSIHFGDIDLVKLPESTLTKEIRWRKISMVFQNSLNVLNPVLRINDQMSETIRAHISTSKTDCEKIITDALNAVGIEPSRASSYPHELSGGMRQRVVIAIALLLNPDMMICDEPTTAVDVIMQARILNLINELFQKKLKSLIFISHNLAAIKELCNRIIIMYSGKIVEDSDVSTILEKSIHPYTQGLIRSFPSLKTKRAQLEYIPGYPPDLLNPPNGCKFFPRCTYAKDICKNEDPELIEIEKGHFVACHQNNK